MIPLITHDSIDRHLLQSFIDMRKEKGKPITQRGLDLLINKLVRLDSQGHCPNLLLERSIINGDKGWSDVYPDETTLKPVQSFIAQHTDREWANGLRVVK
jgi:hypothetical protein